MGREGEREGVSLYVCVCVWWEETENPLFTGSIFIAPSVEGCANEKPMNPQL